MKLNYEFVSHKELTETEKTILAHLHCPSLTVECWNCRVFALFHSRELRRQPCQKPGQLSAGYPADEWD